MHRSRANLLRVLGVCLLLAAFVGPTRANEPRAIYRHALHATALVETEHGSGTAWVADAGARLLVTSAHVVHNAETVQVIFPEYRDGKVIAERRHYIDKANVVAGVVLDADEPRDLAVIQVAALPAGAVSLPLAEDSPSPGEAIHSVGNPGVSGALWVYTTGPVRTVYVHEGDYAGRPLQARIIESQAPTNPGDSGGPVVNDRSQLVGVVMGYSKQGRLLSHSIDVSEVRPFLTRVRPLASPKTAADFNRRGLHHRRQKRLGHALTDFTTAIRLDPTFQPAYRNRAWLYNERGEYDNAIADCDSVLRMDDRSAAAHRERGYAQGQRGQLAAAVADLTRALDLDPEDRRARRYRQKFLDLQARRVASSAGAR
jgi:hypothetical protein